MLGAAFVLGGVFVRGVCDVDLTGVVTAGLAGVEIADGAGGLGDRAGVGDKEEGLFAAIAECCWRLAELLCGLSKVLLSRP